MLFATSFKRCSSVALVGTAALLVISTMASSDTVNLDALKQQVEALAEKVKELKEANPVDKDAIGATVKELLAAKQQYADNNNGIGVDGKPFEPPLTKAEKKAKAKAEKAAGPCQTSKLPKCGMFHMLIPLNSRLDSLFDSIRTQKQPLRMLKRRRRKRLLPRLKRRQSRVAVLHQ